MGGVSKIQSEEASCLKNITGPEEGEDKVYVMLCFYVFVLTEVLRVVADFSMDRRSLLCLLLIFGMAYAIKKKREPAEWDYRSEAEKVNMRGCANLTTVLDNWKFAIMTQFRNLLLYDHHTVLPDYGRIKSLSEALDDLYKEFNALKERLGELTTKFDGVEAFVDEMTTRRHMAPPRADPKPPTPVKESSMVPGLQLQPALQMKKLDTDLKEDFQEPTNGAFLE
ncbi:uncharacterized protein RCH25_048974 [Pelodytes ibericus]